MISRRLERAARPLIERLDEAPRRRQSIAVLDDVLDLAPVDLAAIEAQPKPPPRPDVRGEVVLVGSSRDTIDILPELGSAADRHNSVAVMERPINFAMDLPGRLPRPLLGPRVAAQGSSATFACIFMLKIVIESSTR